MAGFKLHRPGSHLLVSLLIFALALLASTTARVVIPPTLRQDTPSDYKHHYLPTAQSIAEGRGIMGANGKMELAVPPGFPLLIAGVILLSEGLGMEFDGTINMVNTLLFALSAIILYAIGRRLWGRRFGVIPPLLWLFYPFSLWLTQKANVEVPFFFFLYAGVGLFFAGFTGARRGRFFALSGMAVGVAMLIRPIALLVSVLLAMLTLLGERSRSVIARLGLSLALLGGSLLVILPWEAWVYSQTGRVIPLSANGANSIRDGLTFGVEANGYRSYNLPAGVVNVMADIKARVPRGSSNGALVRQSLAVMREHPLPFMEFLLIKVLRSWYGTDSGRGENLIPLIQMPYLLLMLLGLVFSIRERYVPPLVWMTIALIFLYFWGMTVLVVSILRYMTPIIGLGFLLAPAPLVALMRAWAARPGTYRAGGLSANSSTHAGAALHRPVKTLLLPDKKDRTQ